MNEEIILVHTHLLKYLVNAKCSKKDHHEIIMPLYRYTSAQ